MFNVDDSSGTLSATPCFWGNDEIRDPKPTAFRGRRMEGMIIPDMANCRTSEKGLLKQQDTVLSAETIIDPFGTA